MSDRRHQPTPARLRKAANEGQSAYSHELTVGVSLLTAVAAIACLAAPLLDNLMQFARRQWSTAGHRTDTLVVDQEWLSRIALRALPIVAVILLASWLVACGQRGWRWMAWKWQPARVSPASNLRTLAANADVAVAGWLKSALLTIVAGCLVWREFPLLVTMGEQPVARLAIEWACLAGRLATTMSLAMVAVGIGDWLWQRWRFRRRLRMTDHELREERRQAGAP